MFAQQPANWYRPSPAALGRPDSTDPVDEAVQRAATGYGPAEDVPQALALAEVAVYVRQDGGLVTAASLEGSPVVSVFTASVHLESAGKPAFEVLPVRELVDRLPTGHQLYLNPAGAVAVSVEMEPLPEAMGAARTSGGQGVSG
ncbi:type VII secretion system-associated protein [Streptomyces sp. NPDC051644]|uniref:type VII secretion system-associated protein n=1 Tax=Streptomyces sp. NPDC051644 TaxID=3365666 RepID=UPI0037A8B1D7